MVDNDNIVLGNPCPKCGYGNVHDSKFCNDCGSSMDPQELPRGEGIYVGKMGTLVLETGTRIDPCRYVIPAFCTTIQISLSDTDLKELTVEMEFKSVGVPSIEIPSKESVKITRPIFGTGTRHNSRKSLDIY